MTLAQIFIPESTPDSELCHPVDVEDFERINLLINGINGVPRLAGWKPFKMKLVTLDEGRLLPESDSPWLEPHALIFRPKAVEALGPMLSDYGELLPLNCPGAQLSIFNPTRVLDVLDEAASKVLRFSDGRMMRVNTWAFRPDSLAGVHLFKSQICA